MQSVPGFERSDQRTRLWGGLCGLPVAHHLTAQWSPANGASRAANRGEFPLCQVGDLVTAVFAGVGSSAWDPETGGATYELSLSMFFF